MADKEIGDLATAGALSATDKIHIIQSDNSRQTTIAQVRGGSQVITITDQVDPTFDAQGGMVQVARLTATASRELQAPSNPIDGQKIIIEHIASGGDRTLTLATDGYAFGADITEIATTSSGRKDRIGVVYDGDAALWHVVAVVTGY